MYFYLHDSPRKAATHFQNYFFLKFLPRNFKSKLEVLVQNHYPWRIATAWETSTWRNIFLIEKIPMSTVVGTWQWTDANLSIFVTKLTFEKRITYYLTCQITSCLFQTQITREAARGGGELVIPMFSKHETCFEKDVADTTWCALLWNPVTSL